MNAKLFTIAVASLAAAACASTANQAPTDLPSTRSGVDAGPSYAPGSVEEFVEVAGERVFFGYDSYQLSNQARRTLEAQAAWLQAYSDAVILIAGNCDERGTREYNLALGARRANAARDFLVSLGVDPARITTISYGKERPLDPRSNEQAWSLNRNAHTQIVTDDVIG